MNKSKYLMLAIGAAALLAIVAIAYATGAMRSPAAQPTPAPVHTPPPISGAKGDCTVGGCSNEVCSDLSQGAAISPCIYRPEYVCYKSATCERQPDGQCGWTPTPQLQACLKNPPPLQQ